MMRLFACLALWGTLIGSAAADADRPVLVELFANQNCSACPKAHRTMAQINQERDDILILTWSVSYWDYLGEPDPMALDAAKERQMAYTDRLSLRAPYTPQSFYDGAKECPGTRKRDIRGNIEKRLSLRSESAPRLHWNGKQISVSGESDRALDLVLVEYLTGDANPTQMVNPVKQMVHLGSWQGNVSDFAVSCVGSCAVLLQEPNTGQVIAAKGLSEPRSEGPLKGRAR
ncbi:MAG: DUF1223 domain-containing protein [Pseudomonadota bacterium]